jgi:hypothetical protein
MSSSCTLKEEADLVFPESPGRFFTESYLSAGEPVKLCLLRGSSFQKDLSLQLVWYAKAELLLPDTTITLQNILFKDSESGKLVNYVSTFLLPPLLPEDSLRLRIISEDKADTLYAATELVQPIEITDWSLNDRQIMISCANGTSMRNRFYGVYLEYEREGSIIRKSEFYDYSRTEDSRLTFRLDIPSGDRSYRIILYRITPANYRFQRAIQQASRSNVDPFEAPVVLPTNIRGGQGIFTYSTADTLLIR